MTPAGWRAARVAAGAAVLAAVLGSTGTGPFVDSVRALDAATLALGAALAVPTTVACAWRWHLVARGLGVGVALGPAVASLLRSQFQLNATLPPGGVLGDVHRGVRHGRDAGDTGRRLRAVAWERVAGQVVLVAVSLGVLLLAPSPVRASVPAVVGLLAAGAAAAAVASVLLARRPAAHVPSWAAQVAGTARDDVRRGLLWSAGPGPGWCSPRRSRCSRSRRDLPRRGAPGGRRHGVLVEHLLPLALLVLLASGLPSQRRRLARVPVEGMAAWTFGAAGLGAEPGVAD